MKNSIMFILLILLANSCVQKASKKTIILNLKVSGFKNIQSVGIRGNEKPLSWDTDLALKPIVKDSLYTGFFSIVTGYKFTEAKFVVNGQFELNDKNNRRIEFGDKDTTVYSATFDVAN